jgi:hypothetical protein
MKRVATGLLPAILLLSGLLLAACDEREDAATATPTVSPEVAASPSATATLTPTPVPEPPEFASFREFAREIDRAFQERDTQFFVDRAVISEVECTGREQLGICVDQPAGTALRGVWSTGANGGPIHIVPLDEYQELLSSYFDAATPVHSDELGSGDLVLYGLGSSSADGRPASIVPAGQRAFYAITSAIPAQDQEYRREVRAFVFTWDDGDWRFRWELRKRVSPEQMAIGVYRAWLFGSIPWYYDYWEPWTAATP